MCEKRGGVKAKFITKKVLFIDPCPLREGEQEGREGGRKGLVFVHYSMPKSLGEGGGKYSYGARDTPELAFLPFEKGECTGFPV